MTQLSNKQMYSAAENGKASDRASLLDAINHAVSGLKTKQVKKTDEYSLMKGSNVNHAMARDLKSNAGDF